MIPVVKTNRTAKCQYKCYLCKEPSVPKNGDWVSRGEDAGHDVFVCRTCITHAMRTKPMGTKFTLAHVEPKLASAI